MIPESWYYTLRVLILPLFHSLKMFPYGVVAVQSRDGLTDTGCDIRLLILHFACSNLAFIPLSQDVPLWRCCSPIWRWWSFMFFFDGIASNFIVIAHLKSKYTSYYITLQSYIHGGVATRASYHRASGQAFPAFPSLVFVYVIEEVAHSHAQNKTTNSGSLLHFAWSESAPVLQPGT